MRPLLALGVCALAACGSFSASDTAPDPDASAPVDGSTPADEAGVLDGGLADGGPADGGLKLVLFDDFERNVALDSTLWTKDEVNPMATIETSDVDPFAGARSLHISLEPSGAEGRRAQLRRDLGLNAARLKVSWHMKVTKRPTTGKIYIVEILTEQGHVVAELTNATLDLVTENTAAGKPGLRIPLPLQNGTWQEVVLEYRTSPSPTASMTVGATPVSGPVIEGTGVVRAVEIGSAYASPGDAAEFFIDNVTVERGD